jgi:hypothetical protein
MRVNIRNIFSEIFVLLSDIIEGSTPFNQKKFGYQTFGRHSFCQDNWLKDIWSTQLCLIIGSTVNGTVRFKKCKQLFVYQHLLLETSGVQSSNLYLNAVRFFNTSVN